MVLPIHHKYTLALLQWLFKAVAAANRFAIYTIRVKTIYTVNTAKA